MNLGIVGVGNISGIYLENITKVFKNLNLIGVCDLEREKAEKAQEKYGFPKIYETMYDMFADEEINLILNITRPYQHFEVTKAALLAGKNVYSEKPLGASFEEGKKLVALAEEKGLMLGGAPDTFMGAAIQTCRKLIDDGLIGEVIGAQGTMMSHGVESWHPDPEFFYKFGGGPMLDMGPYYVTALINLIGRCEAVTGVAKTSFKKRVITSEPHKGEVIDVEVPTYITGVMHFENGAIANLTTSFDVYRSDSHDIEIYGSKGTLFVPDPNCFDGKIRFYNGETGKEEIIQSEFDYSSNSRALGLAEFAKSIEEGRLPRASYKQTLHVLEIMSAFAESSENGGKTKITSPYERSAPMFRGLPLGEID